MQFNHLNQRWVCIWLSVLGELNYLGGWLSTVHLSWITIETTLHTGISRKFVARKCTQQCQKVLWVVLSSLFIYLAQ